MRISLESKLGYLVSSVLVVTSLGCASEGGTEADDSAACLAELAVDQTFSLPQEAGDRSFQTHAYFDGQAVWIAHAIAPVSGNAIVIQSLRVRCDGSVANAPVVISPDNGFTHTEPRITGYGDKVMIAWQTDNQGNPNLSTHYRVFNKVDGPADEPTIHLDTQYMGASASNTWMPAIAASASGFVVGGLRGVSDYQSFQSFMQRIDEEGVMVGDAINGELQDDMAQRDTTIALDDQGNAILAWERTDTNDTQHVVHSRIQAGQDAPEGQPVRVSGSPGSQAALAGSAETGLYLASSRDEGGLMLKPGNVFDPDSPTLSLGTSGKVAFYPQPAAKQGGGAVAWLESTSGINSEIHLQAFADDGTTLSAAGDEIIITTDNPSITPYRLSFVHVVDSVFLLTWTEGPASELQVKWRFVDVIL